MLQGAACKGTDDLSLLGCETVSFGE